MEEKAVIGPERCIGCVKCIARVRIILRGFILAWIRDLNSIMPRGEA